MVMRAMGAWMRKKKKRETMTVTCKKWSQTGEKGIESWEVRLGVCVCAAVCCNTQQHRGGGSERQKSTLYIENMRGGDHLHTQNPFTFLNLKPPLYSSVSVGHF